MNAQAMNYEEAVNYEDSILGFGKNAFVEAWNESMSDSTKEGVALWHARYFHDDAESSSEIAPEEAMDLAGCNVRDLVDEYLGDILKEEEADSIIKQLDSQYGDGYAPIELVWEEPETKPQEIDNKHARVNALVERCIIAGFSEGACSILDKE